MQQLPPTGVWLSRTTSFILTVVTLVALCLPAAMQMTGLSSNVEVVLNRPLGAMPPAPKSILEFEGFRRGITGFVEDHFGLRTEMIQLNYFLHAWLGTSSSEAHIVGKNGWFFIKESEKTLDQFRGVNRFTDRQVDDWIDNIEMYREWLSQHHIAFRVVIAPNKETIYADYMPFYATRAWPETRLDQLTRRLHERRSAISFIDLRAPLFAARPIGDLYRKYESHWNYIGGYLAYSALAKELKETFPSIRPVEPHELRASNLKQYWFVPPQSEIETVLSFRDPALVGVGDVVETVGGRRVWRYANPKSDSINVIMYGDSFGESLLYLFFATFKSLTFFPMASLPFPREQIEKTHPDLVIFEIVERGLINPIRVDAKVETDFLAARAPSYPATRAAIGKIGGYVDGVLRDGDIFRFTGWATEGESNAPGKVVFAFDGEKLITAARPSFDRPDVRPGMLDQRAGFMLSVPANVDVRHAGQELRFFSLNAEGKVFELIVHPAVTATLEQLAGAK